MIRVILIYSSAYCIHVMEDAYKLEQVEVYKFYWTSRRWVGKSSYYVTRDRKESTSCRGGSHSSQWNKQVTEQPSEKATNPYGRIRRLKPFFFFGVSFLSDWYNFPVEKAWKTKVWRDKHQWMNMVWKSGLVAICKARWKAEILTLGECLGAKSLSLLPWVFLIHRDLGLLAHIGLTAFHKLLYACSQ